MDAHAGVWLESSTAREDRGAASGVQVWLRGCWKQFSPRWIKPWALQVRARSVLGVSGSPRSASPACPRGFPRLGGPCQALHALCSLQGCCEGCTGQGCSRPIACRVDAPAGNPPARRVCGILFKKGFSPPCPHMGPRQCHGAELAQKHQVWGGQLPPCCLGSTSSPQMLALWAERSLPSLRNANVTPRWLIREPGASPTERGPGREQPRDRVAPLPGPGG